MTEAPYRLDTQLVHAGEPEVALGGAVVPPVFQSATFTSIDTDGAYDDLRYLRLSNSPNHAILHAKLAAVCGAEAALVTASGMAAITTTVLALVKSGDHLLAQDCLYGGTRTWLEQLAADAGVAVDFVPGNDPDAWSGHLRPRTRLFYVETMTNPLLEVADLEAVVAFCRGHRLLSVVDNTFASPVNFRPLDLGFDLELHSATKYLNGHSDIVAGCVLGTAPTVERIRHRLNHLGGTLDPHACFLLHRGLRTLALRVRQQNANAQQLAVLLASRGEVAAVHYPGLATHPQHDRAARLFGGCGGVLSFVPHGGVAAAERILAGLRLARCAPSLGGVETLVTRPARTSHRGVSAAARAQLGIHDQLVRVAVGIEDGADLCADFARVLGQVDHR